VIELTRGAIVAGSLALSACSSSPSVTIGPPYGMAVVVYSDSEKVPDGIMFGTTACQGDIYFDFGGGYAYCDGGIWDFSEDAPTSFGDYTIDQTLQAEAASEAASDSSATSDTSASSVTSASSGTSSESRSASSSDDSGSEASEASDSSSK
jgi:hypothetical protein